MYLFNPASNLANKKLIAQEEYCLIFPHWHTIPKFTVYHTTLYIFFFMFIAFGFFFFLAKTCYFVENGEHLINNLPLVRAHFN